ncbi:MAG: HlyD family efflux transporter periplasmic adaptor subunit, partial [Planctomycetaceae bacterium]|nr:HlyD family efflux transporter periplasmic adaptor subunit [Planctomycetaceae bacterium]
QQSVTGTGSVLAFAPNQRAQVIEAPIKGRIVQWGDGIVENAKVTKGQLICEIRDLDEEYVSRLQGQLENMQDVVKSAEQQLQANERALADAKLIGESYESQLRAYDIVKTETTAAQDAFVEMARQKLEAEKQTLAEYEAAIPQLEAEWKRIKTLEEEDNISLQKFQEVDRKLSEAKAKVARAEFYVKSAESELEGKTRERKSKIEQVQVYVEDAQAKLRKARTDASKIEGDIQKVKQEFSKAEKEVAEVEVKLARQKSQQLNAPFDGFVVEIKPNMGTSILKEGDAICTIVPQTSDRSVQIWVDGNDAPLIEPGRHARLQFEGWPAVQFSGWPSVAVGTFGGEVVSVDSTDNGKGKFRILIRPDSESEPWPEERFLRQGVRANAWVLLNRVPLWYEVWRQLNGFPPVISMDKPDDGKDKPAKPPKLPK